MLRKLVGSMITNTRLKIMITKKKEYTIKEYDKIRVYD